MGLLDYYRQFEGLSEEEVNRELREEAAERRRKALTRVQTLDLSQTTWPDLPHANIANAITFTARAGLQLYPYLRGSELRSELAEPPRHRPGPPDPRQRRGAAAERGHPRSDRARPGAHHRRGPPTPCFRSWRAARTVARCAVSGGVDALLAAVAEHDTRVVALASPNDPTGELLAESRSWSDCSTACRTAWRCCSTRRSSSSPTPSRTDASLALLEEHPRLLVFRSFSKAWGMAGLRIGYAMGGPGSEELLGELEPDLGVNELSQAGALEALRRALEAAHPPRAHDRGGARRV